MSLHDFLAKCVTGEVRTGTIIFHPAYGGFWLKLQCGEFTQDFSVWDCEAPNASLVTESTSEHGT